MGAIVVRGTPEKPRFYLRYVDSDGSRRMIAAKGCAKRQEAERLLKTIEYRVMSGQLGVPQQEQPTVEEARRKTITVREIGQKFTKEYVDRDVKDIAAYREAQRTVLDSRVYEKLGDRPAASVTRRDVDLFLHGLSEAEYAPSSVNNTLNTLSKLFGWARAEGQIDCANPCSGIARFRSEEEDGPIEPDKFLSREEVQKLLASAESATVVGVSSWEAFMLHPMLATAVYTGLRKGEMFGLMWTHVHFDRMQLTVSRSYAGKTKSGRARHVPISPKLEPILRRWREVCPKTDAGLVFPIVGNADEMGASWQMLGIEYAMKRAKVRVLSRAWHSMRHTFASHFVMSGGNILTLQRLLGHAKVQTTASVYSHLAPDFNAAEVARLDFTPARPASVSDISEARRKKLLEQLEHDPTALWEAMEQLRSAATMMSDSLCSQ